MAKLDVFDFDINKLLNRMKKKHIRPIMCQPHPTLNGIPVMVNSKGEHSLPVAPENGLPPISGPATDSFGAADGAAFSGSLGDAGGAVSMGESLESKDPVLVQIQFGVKSVEGITIPKKLDGVIEYATALAERAGKTEKEDERNTCIKNLNVVCSNYVTKFPKDKVDSLLVWQELLAKEDKFTKLVDDYNKLANKPSTGFLGYFYSAARRITKYNPIDKNRTLEGKRNLYDSTIGRLKSKGNLEPTDSAIIEESKLHLFNENNKDLVNAIKEKVGDVTDSEIKTIIDALYNKGSYTDNEIVLDKEDFNGKGLYDPYNNNKSLEEKDLQDLRNYKNLANTVSLDARIGNGDGDDKEITVGDTVTDNTEEERETRENVLDMLSILKNSEFINDVEKEIFKQYMGFDEEGNKIEGKSIADIAKNNGYTRFHTQEIISDINAKLRLARSAE